MANYIPFEKEPAKKQRILTKREDELRHALRNDLPEQKIVKAAERIRQAKIGVLKGQRHCEQIYRGSDDDPSRHRHLDNIDKEHSKWSSMSVQEIVEMYQ